MKNKLLLLMLVVSLFVTLSASSALAKTVDVWADESYNFKNVQSLMFDDVKFATFGNPAPDDLLYKKMALCNQKTAESAKFNVIPDAETMPDKAIKFLITIETWDSSEVWNEPYTTMEKRKGTREIKKSDGNKITETFTYEVPVQHPDYYSYWSHVQVRYDGYTKDNKLVYTHRESRNREDGRAHFKMYERITKDFLIRFAKLTK